MSSVSTAMRIIYPTQSHFARALGTSLSDLISGNAVAVRVPGFFSEKACAHAVKRLEDMKVKEYTNAPGIGRVGISFFETVENSEMKALYFSSVGENFSFARDLFEPFANPIDLVRLTVDEAWKQGATLLREDENPLFCGLIRVLEVGKGILPHEDKLTRDAPELATATKTAQIATNVYLQVGSSGGEVELYKESLPTKTYDKLRGESYGIDRKHLPPPDVVYLPKAGELAFFNPSNLHAVSRVEEKSRITASTFIGCETLTKPLRFWS